MWVWIPINDLLCVLLGAGLGLNALFGVLPCQLSPVCAIEVGDEESKSSTGFPSKLAPPSSSLIEHCGSGSSVTGSVSLCVFLSFHDHRPPGKDTPNLLFFSVFPPLEPPGLSLTSTTDTMDTILPELAIPGADSSEDVFLSELLNQLPCLLLGGGICEEGDATRCCCSCCVCEEP